MQNKGFYTLITSDSFHSTSINFVQRMNVWKVLLSDDSVQELKGISDSSQADTRRKSIFGDTDGFSNVVDFHGRISFSYSSDDDYYWFVIVYFLCEFCHVDKSGLS